MNWRKILFLHTANVLDVIGESELAVRLRTVIVPEIDGGCFKYLVRGRNPNEGYVSREYQTFRERDAVAEFRNGTEGRDCVASDRRLELIFPLWLEVAVHDVPKIEQEVSVKLPEFLTEGVLSRA